MKIREKIKIKKAVLWTGASIIYGSPDEWISHISTDSRTIENNDFFIPVSGENFDGHDFICDAVKSGASGFVCEKSKTVKAAGVLKELKGSLVVLEVEDTMDFLRKLAGGYIMQFKVKSIGITGSLGKTTTKNLISSILSEKYNTVFTPSCFACVKDSFNSSPTILKTAAFSA